MIGLMVAIESALVRLELRLTGTGALAWRTGGRSARTDSLGAEILCFGDSLVKHGVLPRVLEAELGRTAYNLALPASHSPASYFLLQRALKAGARPRALVVDFHSTTLTPSVRPNSELWPELLDGQELLDLGWHARDGRFFGSTAVALLCRSVRYRQGIRRRAMATLMGEDLDQTLVLDAYERNGRVNRGAVVVAAALIPPSETEELGQQPLGTTRFRPHPVNVSYVRRFLDLAAAHRLPVFWLIPPTTPAWQGQSERLGDDARYTQFVRTMLVRYPTLVVVDGRHAGYTRSVFADPTHLNARGAAALSGALATILRPCLADNAPDSRWVTLPAFRDRPDATLLLEDLVQSRVALGTVPNQARRY